MQKYRKTILLLFEPKALFNCLGVISLVALICASVGLLKLPERIQFSGYTDIESALPEPPASIVIKDEPLAATESAITSALGTLQLTDYIYKRISSPRGDLFLYVASWAPGKMPAWDVGNHNPDNCWIGAGAQILDMRDFRPDLASYGNVFSSGKWRRFSFPQSNSVETIFWHNVGGKPYIWFENKRGLVNLIRLLPEFIKHRLFASRGEQVFIRIHSDDLIEILDDHETVVWLEYTIEIFLGYR